MNLYNPHSCKVVVRREHPDAYRIEAEAHRILAPYAIGREWFKTDPVSVRSAITSAIKEVNKTRRVWKAEPKRTHQDPELARQMTLRMCENVFREMQK